MLMLLFYCGQKRLACSYECIAEILPLVTLQTSIELPSLAAGILNYGGKLVPVFDLCEILENRKSENQMHTRVLLLKPSQSAIYGLIVEKAVLTFEAKPEAFHSVLLEENPHTFLRGVANGSEGVIQLFDVQEFYNQYVHAETR